MINDRTVYRWSLWNLVTQFAELARNTLPSPAQRVVSIHDDAKDFSWALLQSHTQSQKHPLETAPILKVLFDFLEPITSSEVFDQIEIIGTLNE